MNYMKQFGIILAVSLVGELLNYSIKLPIPASIYGLALMFVCLHFKLIRVGAVRQAGYFLLDIMPLMFIPVAVGLMTSWDLIKPSLPAYIVITVLSTFGVMFVAGLVTQRMIRSSRKRATST